MDKLYHNLFSKGRKSLEHNQWVSILNEWVRLRAINKLFWHLMPQSPYNVYPKSFINVIFVASTNISNFSYLKKTSSILLLVDIVNFDSLRIVISLTILKRI